MYGGLFINMCDTRKLLLEYSSTYNPLLKTFNVESYKDINYNIFLGDVYITPSEVIEL
jgi:NADH:ubiquinone oxidoreductase subunit C